MFTLLCKSGKMFSGNNNCIFSIINRIRIERIFVVLGLLLGLFYSIVTPPGQVPDEKTHWNFAKTAYGFYPEEYEVEAYFQNIGFYDYYTNINNSQNIEMIKSEMDEHFSDEARSIVSFPSLSIIRYFPSGLVMSICILLDLPIFWVLQLSEFAAVLFYVIMGYFALKKMPVMREVLFVVMLLPMTLQQCTTINYDAVLLPVSFWLFAHLMYLIFEAQEIRWKHIIPLLIAGFVVLYIKPPVFLILLLFFTVDKNKVKLNIGSRIELYSLICKYKYILCLCAVVLGLAGIYILRDNSYIRLLSVAVHEPEKTVSIFLNTFTDYSAFYLQTIAGNFGWLSMPMPESYIKMLFIMLISISLCARNDIKINNKVRVVGIIISIAIIFLILLALFPWIFTIQGYNISTLTYEELYQQYLNVPHIEGVQGRYFIPILPVIALAFGGIIKKGKNYLTVINILLFVGLNIWACISLVDRFWIA